MGVSFSKDPLGKTCCEYKLAILGSKILESRLEERFGASGKGLHEKVSSIEVTLPSDLIKKLRRIATIRNQIVHSVDFDHDGFDAKDYRKCFIEAESGLNELYKSRSKTQGSGLCTIC